MIPPLISVIYSLVSFALGAKNAEYSKGDSTSLVVGTLILGVCGFFVSTLAVGLSQDFNHPGWMMWLLYIATGVIAAIAHFAGFFLCSVLHAAGNDVSA